MGHTAVGNNFFDVHLTERGETGIHNPHQRQSGHIGLVVEGGQREEGKHKTQVPIGPQLQDNGSQENGTPRRGLHMGFRQPQMEGDHGHFNGKSQHEPEEQQLLGAFREGHRQESLEMGGGSLQVEETDRREHHQGSPEGVEEQGEGRRETAVTALVLTHHVEEGHQHTLKAEVEHHHVQHQEHGHQQGLDQEQGARLFRFHQQADGQDKGREEHEGEGDPVQS